MSQSHTNSAKIGIATATIVGMNAMIGSGVFTMPGVLAQSVGPAGIITTILVACCAYFMAASIARVAYLFPQEGSFYTYARQWGGHRMGIVASGAYLIGLIIAMGLLCKVAGVYLQHYIPYLTDHTLGFITLLALVILNMVGVTLSELGQHILIVCTTFPLIATIVMCFTKMNLSNLTPFTPHGIMPIFSASKEVLFSFFGFEAAASLFAVVQDPEKNVPRALVYSLAIVSVLYILFAWAILTTTPLSLLPGPFSALSDALRHVFPTHPWLIESIHFSILSAIVGTIHSMVWSSGSLLIALVKKLQSAPMRALAQSRYLTTPLAVLVIGTCIFASFTLITGNLFFLLTAIFIVFAYMASMVTLLTIPSEWRNGQNKKTVIGLATALVIFAFATYDLAHAVILLFR